MRNLLTSAAGALGIAAVLLLGACTSSGTEASAAGSPTSASSVTASAPTTVASTNSASQPEPGHTCPATSAQIPAGAHQQQTADVDYDGAADTLWLADVNGVRTVGIRTASGATFSTTFTSSAPQAASALAQKMADENTPSIILLDTGRSVKLYTIADCAIVPTKNAQSAQYTFDLGFTGTGTGVECTSDGAGYTLDGLLAKPSSTGASVTVYRTPVTLSNYGRRARNGTRQTLASRVDSQSTVAKHATSVSCGTDNTAVTEPQAG